MDIILSKQWEEQWKPAYKFCMYAHFMAAVQQSSETYRSELEAKNAKNRHIIDMKTYLLYFDFVILPFGNLYKGVDEFNSYILSNIVKDSEFKKLFNRKLLIGTTHISRSIKDTLLTRVESLKEIGWGYEHQFEDNLLIDLMQSTILYEREAVKMSQSLDKLIDKRIKNISNKRKRTKARKIYNSSVGFKTYRFSHEKFVLENNKRNFDRRFLISTNIDYYEVSEKGNPGSVIPFHSNCNDFMNRKSINGVFSYLYSIDFFKVFLSLFIDASKVVNIYKVDPDDILSLRANAYWRPAIEEYHNLLEDISKEIENISADNILDLGISRLGDKLINKNNVFLFDVVLGVAMLALSPLNLMRKSDELKRLYEKKKNISYLKISSGNLYKYIHDLSKILK